MKKLNSFILPDNIIEKMIGSIKLSKENNIEVGFNLCSSNNQLHDESYCKGNECSVDIPKGCKEGDHVGLFHTHTSSLGTEPSIQDIANAYLIGINCIGDTIDNKINCYSRKDNIPKRDDLEIIVSALIRYEQPLNKSEFPEEDIKNYEKWKKVRTDLKKEFMKTINVR